MYPNQIDPPMVNGPHKRSGALVGIHTTDKGDIKLEFKFKIDGSSQSVIIMVQPEEKWDFPYANAEHMVRVDDQPAGLRITHIRNYQHEKRDVWYDVVKE